MQVPSSCELRSPPLSPGELSWLLRCPSRAWLGLRSQHACKSVPAREQRAGRVGLRPTSPVEPECQLGPQPPSLETGVAVPASLASRAAEKKVANQIGLVPSVKKFETAGPLI